MILYLYMTVGVLGGILVPFGAGMVNSAVDIWKIILLIIGFAAGLVILHILAAGVISLFINKEKKVDSLNNGTRKFALVTLDLALRVMGAKVTVKGKEKLPKEPFLMVCNHRSLFDAVAAVVHFGKQNLAFVSKKENLKIPFIGQYMVKLGCLFLDREDTRAAIKTINSAADMISTGMASVAICPEGTRNRTEELLLPFHAGSFKIAQKAKCPVVVMSVWGTEHLKKRMFFKRTEICIDVINVVSADKVQELRSNELADLTRDIMLSNLERYI